MFSSNGNVKRRKSGSGFRGGVVSDALSRLSSQSDNQVSSKKDSEHPKRPSNGVASVREMIQRYETTSVQSESVHGVSLSFCYEKEGTEEKNEIKEEHGDAISTISPDSQEDVDQTIAERPQFEFEKESPEEHFLNSNPEKEEEKKSELNGRLPQPEEKTPATPVNDIAKAGETVVEIENASPVQPSTKKEDEQTTSVVSDFVSSEEADSQLEESVVQDNENSTATGEEDEFVLEDKANAKATTIKERKAKFLSSVEKCTEDVYSKRSARTKPGEMARRKAACRWEKVLNSQEQLHVKRKDLLVCNTGSCEEKRLLFEAQQLREEQAPDTTKERIQRLSDTCSATQNVEAAARKERKITFEKKWVNHECENINKQKVSLLLEEKSKVVERMRAKADSWLRTIEVTDERPEEQDVIAGESEDEQQVYENVDDIGDSSDTQTEMSSSDDEKAAPAQENDRAASCTEIVGIDSNDVQDVELEATRSFDLQNEVVTSEIEDQLRNSELTIKDQPWRANRDQVVEAFGPSEPCPNNKRGTLHDTNFPIKEESVTMEGGHKDEQVIINSYEESMKQEPQIEQELPILDQVQLKGKDSVEEGIENEISSPSAMPSVETQISSSHMLEAVPKSMSANPVEQQAKPSQGTYPFASGSQSSLTSGSHSSLIDTKSKDKLWPTDDKSESQEEHPAVNKEDVNPGVKHQAGNNTMKDPKSDDDETTSYPDESNLPDEHTETETSTFAGCEIDGADYLLRTFQRNKGPEKRHIKPNKNSAGLSLFECGAKPLQGTYRFASGSHSSLIDTKPENKLWPADDKRETQEEHPAVNKEDVNPGVKYQAGNNTMEDPKSDDDETTSYPDESNLPDEHTETETPTFAGCEIVGADYLLRTFQRNKGPQKRHIKPNKNSAGLCLFECGAKPSEGTYGFASGSHSSLTSGSHSSLIDTKPEGKLWPADDKSESQEEHPVVTKEDVNPGVKHQVGNNMMKDPKSDDDETTSYPDESNLPDEHTETETPTFAGCEIDGADYLLRTFQRNKGPQKRHIKPNKNGAGLSLFECGTNNKQEGLPDNIDTSQISEVEDKVQISGELDIQETKEFKSVNIQNIGKPIEVEISEPTIIQEVPLTQQVPETETPADIHPKHPTHMDASHLQYQNDSINRVLERGSAYTRTITKILRIVFWSVLVLFLLLIVYLCSNLFISPPEVTEPEPEQNLFLKLYHFLLYQCLLLTITALF